MPAKKPDPAIAHVHAPRFPQDPVEFLGNRRGLERLINALIDAVDLGQRRGRGVYERGGGARPAHIKLTVMTGLA